MCGQNVELLNVKPVGTYIDQWGSRSEIGKADRGMPYATEILVIYL